MLLPLTLPLPFLLPPLPLPSLMIGGESIPIDPLANSEMIPEALGLPITWAKSCSISRSAPPNSLPRKSMIIMKRPRVEELEEEFLCM